MIHGRIIQAATGNMSFDSCAAGIQGGRDTALKQPDFFSYETERCLAGAVLSYQDLLISGMMEFSGCHAGEEGGLIHLLVNVPVIAHVPGRRNQVAPSWLTATSRNQLVA